MVKNIDQRDSQRDTIERLVENEGKLKSYALKLTKDPTEAEDLTQNAFARYLEKIHLFKPGTNLMGWAKTVMYNLYISQYRKGSRELRGKDNYYKTYADEKYTHYDDEVGQDEIRAEIKDALMELKPEWRKLLIRHVVFGITYKEVARLHDIPVGTVMSRLSRSKTILREKLYGLEII